MKNQEIYDAALHLASELTSTDQTVNADYRERAPYLLAMVCRQCEPTENACRTAKGKSAVVLPATLTYALTDSFPLSDALASAAAFGLACLLTADENPDLSADFRARFREQLASLTVALPMRPEPITDRYPERQ